MSCHRRRRLFDVSPTLVFVVVAMVVSYATVGTTNAQKVDRVVVKVDENKQDNDVKGDFLFFLLLLTGD